MFGRNQEFLNYNVYPSDDGKEILAEEALSRIETVGGVDYLDGFKIPADNDEIFGGSKTYRASVEKWHWRTNENGKEEFYATQESHNFDSTFTNQQAREANISGIASGYALLCGNAEIKADVVLVHLISRLPTI